MTTNSIIVEEYLTVEELGERIKYKKQSIYNKIYKGVFVLGKHFLKPSPKKILFKWSEILKWLGDKPYDQIKETKVFDNPKKPNKTTSINKKNSEKCKIKI